MAGCENPGSMDCFLLQGGRRLQGQVMASGSKNASLPILAASLLLDGAWQLQKVPRLRDVATMQDLLSALGVQSQWRAEAMEIQPQSSEPTEAPYDIVRRMRASICVLGPLLAKRGSARVSLPGGCVFGARPVDLHVRGLQALGAKIEQEGGDLVATVPPSGLRGVAIDLRSAYGSTVLGTINVMMAACLARGETVIGSAAREPEVVEVASFLRACGAKIEGAGEDRIHIEGGHALRPVSWALSADRMETGTLLLAGAITRGQVRVLGCRPQDLQSLQSMLLAVGCRLQVGTDWLEVDARDGSWSAVDVETGVYPGFPTDLQAQWMAFATQMEGRSRIVEKIYPERFMHVPELQRLGARLNRQGNQVQVQGPARLTAAPVLASDLRASACLVLAGLVARGTTCVRRVYHLDRGYVALEEKLSALGAKVVRQRDAQAP